VDIGHLFERFTVATTTWLTDMAYLCHKWPRICSTDMGPFNGKNTNPETFLDNFVNIIFNTNPNPYPALTLILILTPTLFVHDLVFPKYSTFHSLISMDL
jgi:hypothetical protein